MLLGARAGGWSRRSSRLLCKTPLREYDTVWGNVIGRNPDLPIIALTNINGKPIALDRERFALVALPSLAPFSGRPRFVASLTN
jgi:hypothetical protein